MTIHKCDICNKEVKAWLNVSTYIDIGKNYSEDVSDLAPYSGSYEICKDCFQKLMRPEETK